MTNSVSKNIFSGFVLMALAVATTTDSTTFTNLDPDLLFEEVISSFGVDAFASGAQVFTENDQITVYENSSDNVILPLVNDALLNPGPIFLCTPGNGGNFADTPPNGTVALSGNDTVLYSPNLGFLGSESFSYCATDNLGAVGYATITVNVIPAAIDLNLTLYKDQQNQDIVVGELVTIQVDIKNNGVTPVLNSETALTVDATKLDLQANSAVFGEINGQKYTFWDNLKNWISPSVYADTLSSSGNQVVISIDQLNPGQTRSVTFVVLARSQDIGSINGVISLNGVATASGQIGVQAGLSTLPLIRTGGSLAEEARNSNLLVAVVGVFAGLIGVFLVRIRQLGKK